MSKIICIIDDDPIYQLLIKKSIGISNTGYDTLYFKNGSEAVEYFTVALNHQLPEIILLDLEMPIMDGWDFLKEIDLFNTDHTDIYIVSSSISHEDKEKAKTFTKIKGFFSKPFHSDQILQITRSRA